MCGLLVYGGYLERQGGENMLALGKGDEVVKNMGPHSGEASIS